MTKQYTSTSTSTLPQFNTTHLAWEPLRKNLFEITFNFNDISDEESELLTEQLISVKKNKIRFNINLDEQDNIIPLNIINKIIGKKGNVEINLHHKDGTIHNRIYIKGFQFSKICKDFFDLSYEEEQLNDLKVKFVYDSYKIVGNKNIDMFTLNKKIKKLKCTT